MSRWSLFYNPEGRLCLCDRSLHINELRSACGSYRESYLHSKPLDYVSRTVMCPDCMAAAPADVVAEVRLLRGRRVIYASGLKLRWEGEP